MYQAMLARLEYDGDHPERPRRELDRLLEVDDWQVPGIAWRRPTVRRDAGEPYWWRGDEDASQTFLLSMGVVM